MDINAIMGRMMAKSKKAQAVGDFHPFEIMVVCILALALLPVITGVVDSTNNCHSVDPPADNSTTCTFNTTETLVLDLVAFIFVLGVVYFAVAKTGLLRQGSF